MDQDSGSYVTAFDKKTGDRRWRVDRPGQTHGYGSPALWIPEDGPAQVILSGAMRISGHSLVDGKMLWWVDGSAQQPMTSPIVRDGLCIVCAYSGPSTEAGLPKLIGSFEDALVERDANGDGLLGPDEFENAMLKMAFFVFDLDDDGFFDERDWDYIVTSCGPTGGLFAIELGGKGDVTESHVLWKYDGRRGLAEAASPLLLEDRIFLLKSGGLLSTFDLATGDIDRMERVGSPDQYWASPVVADGKMYLASLTGQLTVLTASKEWEVLSSTDLGEQTWSTPAIAGDQILVRTQKALYCFGLPEAK
jgi:outer membrane protein assembly factor BamB